MTGVVLALLAAASAKPAVGRPALDELAVRIVEQSESAHPEPPVAVFVEGNPPVLARAFASAISSELAARHRAPTVLEVSTAAEAETAARSKDLRTLFRLTIALEGTRLTARGDAIHTWVNFWAGAAGTRTGQSGTLTAVVDADAQALSLAAQPAPPPLPAGPLKLSLTSLAHLSSFPAAIAIGDVDGDGKPEIAVLLDDGVSVLDLDGHLKWRHELKDAPLAVSPPREPFGAISILNSPPRIVVFSGRHTRAEVLVLKGNELKASLSNEPVFIDSVAVRPSPGLNVFDKQISLGGKSVDLALPLTAVSSRGAVALGVFPDGSAALLHAAMPPTRFTGAGAASTLADLDGDGVPEVFLSSTRFSTDADPLQVVSLATAEALQSHAGSAVEGPALWQGATPHGRALIAVAADLDADHCEEVVLGLWLSDGTGELMVAHRLTGT